MEKSIKGPGYRTMKRMSRDQPRCVYALFPGGVYQVYSPPGRTEGLRPHSGLNGHEHTHPHTLIE